VRLLPAGLLLACLLWAVPVWAATYYMSTTGSDANSCATAQNISTPKTTFNSAIPCLSAGDTLIVRGGNYSQAIKTASISPFPEGSSWSNPITIKAASGETVWLLAHPAIDLNTSSDTVQFIVFDGLNVDASGGSSEAVFCGGTTVHDLRFQNMEVKNAALTGIAIHPASVSSTGSCAHLEFSNMHVHHNGSGFFDHGFYTNGQSMLIHDSEIDHNTGYGIQIYTSDLPNNSDNDQVYRNTIHDNGTGSTAGGITGGPGNNILIANNLIYNNNGGGITPLTNGCPDNTQIYNNTITGNTGWGIEIQPCPTNTQIKNNIIYNNSGTQIGDSGTGTVYAGNVCGTSDPGKCAVVGNPSFSDAVFHLNSGSNAIDRGVTLGVVTDDYDGNPRPQGTSYDSGAYEVTTGCGGCATGPGTFYVSPSGSDSQPCDTVTIASPRQTAAGGLACMTFAGSTLYFRAGTYTLAFDSAVTPIGGGTAWNNPMTIAAYNGETVTLQLPPGSSAVFYLRNPTKDQYVLFDGLILDAQSVTNSNALVAEGVSHIKFQNGEMKNSYYEPAYINGSSDVTILNTRVHDWTHEDGIHVVGTSSDILVQQSEIYSGVGSGVKADGSDMPTGTITNVIVARTSIHGVGTTESQYALVVGGTGATGFLLKNNLVYGNYGGILGISGLSAPKIYNNTVYGSTVDGIHINSGVSNAALTNNIANSNAGQNITNSGTNTTQTTNFTTEAIFVNAAGNNFRLDPTAVLVIDQGTALVTDVPDDYAGTIRPHNLVYDPGAYEFTGVLPSNNTYPLPIFMRRGR
jgi:parallel beta-helix repeat protein